MRSEPIPNAWSASMVTSKRFRCGFCDTFVAPNNGWDNQHSSYWLRICTNCYRPTYWNGGEQLPGVAFGNPVQKLPEDVSALYEEARACCAGSSYTAAVLVLRKLLMNIAVQKKASKDLSFLEYVEHMSSQGYIPPDGKSWVDHIRKKGNEATHEIKLMDKDDAEDLIKFSEMLLKFTPPPLDQAQLRLCHGAPARPRESHRTLSTDAGRVGRRSPIRGRDSRPAPAWSVP